MSIDDALALFAERGITLRVDAPGTRLVLSPADAVTDRMVAFIRTHKPALVAELVRRTNAALLHDTQTEITAGLATCAVCGVPGRARLLDRTWRCAAHYAPLCDAAWPPIDPTPATAHVTSLWMQDAQGALV